MDVLLFSYCLHHDELGGHRTGARIAGGTPRGAGAICFALLVQVKDSHQGTGNLPVERNALI